MSDQDNPLSQGRDTCHQNSEADEIVSCELTSELTCELTWANEAPPARHLRLVEKTPAAESRPPAAGKGHLARLVHALHASRRIQTAQVSRRFLHLVK